MLSELTCPQPHKTVGIVIHRHHGHAKAVRSIRGQVVPRNPVKAMQLASAASCCNSSPTVALRAGSVKISEHPRSGFRRHGGQIVAVSSAPLAAAIPSL